MIPHANIWAIDQSRFETMCASLRSNVAWPTQHQLSEARELASKQLRKVTGKIAVVPVHGIIEQRMSMMGFFFGGVSTEELEQVMRQLVNARDVEAIVLNVDSPGGVSYGTEELSDAIYSMRGKKPILAIADSLMASAAYWIGSAADQVIATNGADLGSIGVYSLHVDESAFLESQGVKVTIVRAGKYKVEGNPWEPLTDEARDHLQESVDETYTKFVKSVARNRGVGVKEVRENFGQGRIFSAETAVSKNMADRVATFSQVLDKLTGGHDQQAMRAASIEVLRLRQQQRKREASWVAAQTAAGA